MTADRKPGRPQGDTSSDLKLSLLRASIDLFAKRGFDGVSLSQIAEAAGADKRLARYYFGTKDALWIAAITHLVEWFSKDLIEANAFDSGSKTEELKAFIRAFITASARWPQMSRIIVHDGGEDSTRGAFLKENLVGPFYQLLKDLIEGAKAEGAIPDVSSRTIFFMITHGGSFPMALYALTNALEGGDISSEAALKSHADAIIDLLIRAPIASSN
ncbi:TetR/AcrR family transcriptional regulator [Pararhodobacter oceanensis]|uniref:TetR/AcrR family transcriptional regulator n=1 Tax=Pararhodobacter oceanensis TaxID=2172121 RepID=UPI003A95400D